MEWREIMKVAAEMQIILQKNKGYPLLESLFIT